MPRDADRVRLQHIVDHAREAIALTDGRSRGDLDADRVLCHSSILIRLNDRCVSNSPRDSSGSRLQHEGKPIAPDHCEAEQ